MNTKFSINKYIYIFPLYIWEKFPKKYLGPTCTKILLYTKYICICILLNLASLPFASGERNLQSVRGSQGGMLTGEGGFGDGWK